VLAVAGIIGREQSDLGRAVVTRPPNIEHLCDLQLEARMKARSPIGTERASRVAAVAPGSGHQGTR
jgi:hypothetical protein